jgi:hypothetical protein
MIASRLIKLLLHGAAEALDIPNAAAEEVMHHAMLE